MSAIITHRFRKNNVQNVFDEMIQPKAMIAGCTSSGQTVSIPANASIPANLQAGMAVRIVSSGTQGALSTSNTTIVTAIGANTFTINPTPDVGLSNSLLSFYSQYYIGIGKSDPYSGGLDGSDIAPGSPVASSKTEVDVRNNLIALQKISVALNTGSFSSQSGIYGNAGYVLPRYNWASGTYFKAYDSTDPSCFYPSTLTNGATAYPCYAVWNSGSSTRLYLCAQSGIDSSSQQAVSVQPHTNASIIGTVGIAGSDSYRWACISDLGLDNGATLAARNLTTASGNTSSTLDSNQFFKIYRRSTSTGASTTITTPTPSAGTIYSCRVVSGGFGYSLSSTFSIDGDGSGATGKVTSVDSVGAIQTVTMLTPGSGYTTGVVRWTASAGSSPAIILPRIAPQNGFGYDVVSDLPAWYAGFYANFAYDTVYPGTADVPSADQIRQLSLIRNPVVFNSSSGSSITYRCLKSLVVGTNSSAKLPVTGDVIEQTSGTGNGARGYVDFVNIGSPVSTMSTIYYHQNSSNFGTAGLALTPIPFTTGNYKFYSKPAYSSPGTTPVPAVAIASTASSEEYVNGTGEVIFVQNRVPITQAVGQTEAITIVTQF
jgi:hypothetical protein